MIVAFGTFRRLCEPFFHTEYVGCDSDASDFYWGGGVLSSSIGRAPFPFNCLL
jgi:hypothetical protein